MWCVRRTVVVIRACAHDFRIPPVSSFRLVLSCEYKHHIAIAIRGCGGL